MVFAKDHQNTKTPIKLKKLIIAAVLVMITIPVVAIGVGHAQTVRSGPNITVPKGQTVDATLFAGGRNIDIAGTVNGDVFCAGMHITITGTVHGDVICAGQTLRISGTVDGDVRLAGQSVSIGGTIGHSATVAAQSLTTEASSKIAEDLMGGVSDASLNGIIGRDLGIGAGNLILGGEVVRDIKGSTENLTLSGTAVVGGKINYTSNNNLVREPGAKVTGAVTRTTPPKEDNKLGNNFVAVGILWAFYLFFAFLLTAVVLALLFPRLLHEASDYSIKRPGRTALIGFIGLIAAPFIFITLLLTVIGIPLAFILALMWWLIIMLSAPFTGYAIGRFIFKESRHPTLIMLVGEGILLFSFFIPFINIFTIIATGIFGTGSIVSELMRRLPRPEHPIKVAAVVSTKK